MDRARKSFTVLATALAGASALAADRAPVVSPTRGDHDGFQPHIAKTAHAGGTRSGGITIDVYASSAPNAFGSPSWAGYLVNALNALQNGLASVGTRATDPTAYERAPAVIPPGEIAVTSFNSWRGILSPPAPFNNEYGNRMHFGMHAYGDGVTQFTLEDLSFELHSDDPWDSLVFTGDFIGFSYNGTTRYGVDWGTDNAPGGGDDTVYTAGNGATLVDEIVYVGVGNAFWPSGGVPQDDMDDYFAWIASDGPINVSCSYSILGNIGSDSVLIDQVTVDDFGVQGWKSDDTRNPAGADLVGTNYTHYGKPGQPATGADDTAIANQLLFVNGPGGVPALELTKTSTGGNSKCTLSTVNPSGFAADDWRAGFYANYRYYATSATEVAVMKIGVRSPLWGTGAGQSQNGFTAIRSGESAWDLILVDWRGTNPPWTIGAWDRFNTDADTQCWRIFRQAGNGYFSAGPTPPGAQVGWSLNELYAMSDLGTPSHVARTGYTWSQMLFGTGTKVSSIQFGVGSSTGSTTSYIDYVDTSLLNGGARVDFYGPAPINIKAYPSQVPDEQQPRVILGDAPTGFGPDSWQNSATGKVNWHARYLADGNYLSSLFPGQAATLTLNDIASIRYWTKRPTGTAAGRDWLMFIYTRPPGDASWYGKRFVNNYNEHTNIGSWVQYSTDNDMTFRRNSGTPTGLMDFATLKSTYGTELIEMISIQTDSGWSGSFDGYMDGLTITLTDGSVGSVDFVLQPTLTLEPDDECYATGETVTVDLWMHDVPESIVGGQFFLQYDNSKLQYVSATATSPFIPLYLDFPGTGLIDFAVQIPPTGSTTGDAQLGTLTFTALSPICTETDLITWRTHSPPSRLSNTTGQPVYPELVNMDVIDTEAPVIGTAASDQTVECDGAGNVAALTAWLAGNGGATATDNCDSTVTWTHDYTALSDDCGATGSATVTFTATDDCGNFSTTSATFTIEDTTDPTIGTPAANMTVECDGAGNSAALNAWLASNGGAAASDACGGLTWSNSYTALSDLCGATGAATVTFTATDDCGNFSTTSATFTIEDTTDPTIGTPAANMTVECDGAGNTAALNAWVASNGGAAATDVCGGVTWSNNYTALSDLCGATGSATVTFTATDDCGNFATTTATFTIEDTTDPTIGTPAANMTVECDGAGNTAALNAWLASNGGAAATDVCGGVTWSNNFTALSDLCGATGAAMVTFTATDDCGNFSTTSATFTILDTIDPSISGCPANITVPADAGGCDAIVTWTPPTAGDTCGSVALTSTHNPGDTFPPGTTTVTYTATDDCGNDSTCTFNVTVEGTSELVVDVELETGWAFTGTRCIRFELWQCSPPAGPVVVDALVNFVGGVAANQIVDVPCGDYSCITARDRLHSLRQRANSLSVSGTQYDASFTIANGDALRGGNLNDDFYIDILDFGVFSFQFGLSYDSNGDTIADANTTCSTPYPHAEISGSGLYPTTVYTDDFTFIQLNFLDAHESNCCGQAGLTGDDDRNLGFGEARPEPVTSISVDELVARGMGELAAGDLNRDGMLDMLDVAAFVAGARPNRHGAPIDNVPSEVVPAAPPIRIRR